MVKSVAFLWPIFSEEAVAQGIIAHHILDLQDQDRNFTQHPPVGMCLNIHSTDMKQS